jgi:uncharacterized protein YecE (DUF72 family)
LESDETEDWGRIMTAMPATTRRRGTSTAKADAAAAVRRTLDTRAEDLDRVHDPGYEAAAERIADLPEDVATEPIEVAGAGGSSPGLVRVGTASWTDTTMTAAGVFYPNAADTAEERLAYYASRFPVVEVDATYYALPQPRTSELWVERTPPDFTFDVKAHALLTGQGTETRRLPKAIREALPDELAAKSRIYLKDLPDELATEVWRTFADGVEPLRDHHQLGAIFLQYPKWFFTSSQNRDAIREAKGRLGELGLPVAVEFRNASWLNEKNVERTLRFLEDEHIPLVMVDAPQGTKSSVPPIVAVPSPDLAVVRFHGRRDATWEQSGVTPVERFRYLYDRGELEDWVPRIREAAKQARDTHVLMNNCYGNYGATNALEVAALLRDLDVDD